MELTLFLIFGLVIWCLFKRLMVAHRKQLARWPGISLVAKGPRDQILGYAFGTIEGEGLDCCGHLRAITAPPKGLSSLTKKLSNLLEDYSENIYNALTMKLYVPLHNENFIIIMNKYGYKNFKAFEQPGTEIGMLEMRKPLQRLSALMGE